MRIGRVLDRTASAVLIFFVRAYQVLLAPHLVGGCRHVPSCSAYAIDALRTHGCLRGLRLTAVRLWRCRPHGTCGYDPVPERMDTPALIK